MLVHTHIELRLVRHSETRPCCQARDVESANFVPRRDYKYIQLIDLNCIIKGSLAEKLPIYEQHRRVIESLCVVVESSTIAA